VNKKRKEEEEEKNKVRDEMPVCGCASACVLRRAEIDRSGRAKKKEKKEKKQKIKSNNAPRVHLKRRKSVARIKIFTEPQLHLYVKRRPRIKSAS
jgi:hypothetical protein